MKVAILNEISREILRKEIPHFEEVGLKDNPEVMFVRSAELKNEDLPKSLLAICRPGSGTDNIPIEWCNENGVVVFNAPGANANAVKELVVWAMIASLRNLPAALSFMKDYFNSEESPSLEKVKSQFKGEELWGKSILIIGLGKIGMLVAGACSDLGMNVYGYDPYVSADKTPGVLRLSSLNDLPKKISFVSLHQNLTPETRKMVNKTLFDQLRQAVLLNFARGELVDVFDLREALKEHKVKMYASDFPNKVLALEFPRQTLFLPHLGASTKEAEETSLVMVINQVINFLREGRIDNSPNFPNCSLPRRVGARLLFSNRNVPGVISSVTTVLGEARCNVAAMINKSKGEVAYNIVDIDNPPSYVAALASEMIAKLPHITKVRLII